MPADQRDEHAAGNFVADDCAIALLDLIQHLPAGWADRQHHPPRIGELLKQRSGDLRRSGADKDGVVGSMFRPSQRTVPGA